MQKNYYKKNKTLDYKTRNQITRHYYHELKAKEKTIKKQNPNQQ